MISDDRYGENTQQFVSLCVIKTWQEADIHHSMLNHRTYDETEMSETTHTQI